MTELNRNPESFFAEVEHAAFNPATSCRASASRPTPGYEPDSYGEWREQQGALFRLMGPAQKHPLFDNPARSFGEAPRGIPLRHIDSCLRADPACGEGVAKALGIPLSEIPKWPRRLEARLARWMP